MADEAGGTTASVMAEAASRGLRTATEAEERELFVSSNMPIEFNKGIFWTLVLPIDGYDFCGDDLVPKRIKIMGGMGVYPEDHSFCHAAKTPTHLWKNKTAFLFLEE